MLEIAEKWIKDIPQQFQGKKRIEILIDAFSEQLQELEKVFYEINAMTDVKNAKGKNLDLVGKIANISRIDANYLLAHEETSEVGDEVYRNVIRFQILKNNSEATYSDIMEGLNLIWGNSEKISYSEPENEPATIRINVESMSTDDVDPRDIKPAVIRPAGVKLIFQSNFLDTFQLEDWEQFDNCTLEYKNYNWWNGEYDWDGAITWSSGNEEVMSMGKAILLNQAKEKILRSRFNGSGGIVITDFAFGTGAGENAYTPTADQTSLKNEIIRKKADKAQISERCFRYTGVLGAMDANGQYISEIGLVDSDGDLVCIKTFNKKLKTDESEMVFKIDDTF